MEEGKKYPFVCQIIIYDDINHLAGWFIAKNQNCLLKNLSKSIYLRMDEAIKKSTDKNLTATKIRTTIFS